jgi:hypothetical protein
MIKFVCGKNGPRFEVGGASFVFRPIDSKEFSRWAILNSNLTQKDLDRYHKHDDVKAKYKIFLLTLRFVADMLIDVINLKDDETGELIRIEEMTNDDRFRLAEALAEQEEFKDWLEKYRAGAEKKSSKMA